MKANIPTKIAQLSPSERKKLTALLMEQENRDFSGQGRDLYGN